MESEKRPCSPRLMSRLASPSVTDEGRGRAHKGAGEEGDDRLSLPAIGGNEFLNQPHEYAPAALMTERADESTDAHRARHQNASRIPQTRHRLMTTDAATITTVTLLLLLLPALKRFLLQVISPHRHASALRPTL